MPVGDRKIFYRATDNVGRWFDPDREETRDSPPWKPSILMPRAASRLTLTVSYIRAQRLQDISEEDAQSEGCIRLRSGRAVEVQGAQYAGNYWGSPNSWFRTIWAEIHGPDAWTENPWVWALTFTVEQRNIDAARQENAA
ncbi:hypothetical protein AA101099_1805 [Neoasaia chiangmaiensis NBRC 101099]|uniref:Uncharacterized protein n=2 Tax=Neoasaia chiangmaiensis TaxID=320497 RepID=A0A1U9KR80_9PROT|nr:hypothetical protein [Neoasaia chiangmaiensis]AQS88239.1 hypothetical protein A0U93_10150 [Neoasaia chiangmaiensis]GBR39760.1 hypothetical protein AA101099_1805 [Neoasaia chiangmaiensis NBRC 101099]GEN14728.1 hypothetical protein NCH01_11590 [Neoasaia chiangmaiensis]